MPAETGRAGTRERPKRAGRSLTEPAPSSERSNTGTIARDVPLVRFFT